VPGAAAVSHGARPSTGATFLETAMPRERTVRHYSKSSNRHANTAGSTINEDMYPTSFTGRKT
jgi:hypothetical protein